MLKYKLSETAKDDLIRIHRYGTEKFGEAQAEEYFNAFFDCFLQIAEHPFAFERVDFIRHGYRRCVCGVDNIFYRLSDETVEIMAIVGRQDIDQLF